MHFTNKVFLERRDTSRFKEKFHIYLFSSTGTYELLRFALMSMRNNYCKHVLVNKAFNCLKSAPYTYYFLWTIVIYYTKDLRRSGKKQFCYFITWRKIKLILSTILAVFMTPHKLIQFGFKIQQEFKFWQVHLP